MHSAVDIPQRSFQFALRIVRLVNVLPKTTAGYKIGDQLLRSGTSVGANVEEAQNCGSTKELIYTLTIALKEAREALYWLRLIRESELFPLEKTEEIVAENQEIIKILTAIIKNTKRNHP